MAIAETAGKNNRGKDPGKREKVRVEREETKL